MDLNTLVQLAIAGLVAYTAWLNFNTQKVVMETKELALKTEINTNSMKDALVKATATASHAEGREEARVENAVEKATLAKGAENARLETIKGT